ncbi:peptidase S28 [Endogone sp. FLAS-F59071]|nr:peptidase S28 [Endogone sp. FLAS-F59071]|eukprot:RUS20378.1 peptidase S28 [Endogone sp. FLAS-F59071]
MTRLIFIWAIAFTLLATVQATTLTRLFELQHGSKRKVFNVDKQAPGSKPISLTFPQKVDHFNKHNNATFPQRYWVNTTTYRQGGPVIFMNVGEEDASHYVGYLSGGETSLLAEKLGGVVVVYEHRYYGQSNPVPDLSSQNMIYLNLEQSLADMAYFMQSVEIKINGVALPPAPKTPWIPISASYPGALSAWIKHKYPDLVFASIASSAPVQAKYYFWEYFEPIRQGAPAHCRDSIINTVKHVDDILFSHNKRKIQQLKAQFGMPNVTHNDDFAANLIGPVWQWQEIYPGYNNPFLQFCQIFDNATTVNAQIAAYASWMTDSAVTNCPSPRTQDECYGSYDANAHSYTNTQLDNSGRSWIWQTCYEFGYWQSAAPKGHPTLVSRLVTPDYWQRQCPMYFPNSTLLHKPRTEYINKVYGGWNIQDDHIFWINGEFDPWRALGVNSADAPKRLSSNKSPDVVIKGAVHGWDDLWSPTEVLPKPLIEVHNEVILSLTQWLKEFHAK